MLSILLALGISTQSALLDAHNAYRPGHELKWSDSLASEAQHWADNIAARDVMEHSGNPGENIFRGTKGAFTPKAMVDAWGHESQYFKPGVFPNVSTTGNFHDVGHYTQLIWRNTNNVGCGIADSDKYSYLVCRYDPAGNIQGQTP